MQVGRWTTITPSQVAPEREALTYVQQLLPDTEPYRARSNFTFTAQTGHRDGSRGGHNRRPERATQSTVGWPAQRETP
jgi:hypothetical protein